MSRTTRRNKKHLINQFVGTREENLIDPWWRFNYDEGLTHEQMYERRVHWYTRDHRTGRFGVPRWYRQMHGVHLYRRLEKHKLHKHLREDSFDNHLPDPRIRDSMYYWWH